MALHHELADVVLRTVVCIVDTASLGTYVVGSALKHTIDDSCNLRVMFESCRKWPWYLVGYLWTCNCNMAFCGLPMAIVAAVALCLSCPVEASVKPFCPWPCRRPSCILPCQALVT